MSRDMSEHEEDLSDVSMPEESDEDDSGSETSSEDHGTRNISEAPYKPTDRTPSQASNADGRRSESEEDEDEDEDKSLPAGFDTFPPEVWQHIFTYTQPKTLGTLLCVDKAFNSLLDPSSPYPAPAPSPPRNAVPRRTPDDVWRYSRKRFRPQMPSPLDGATELSMWRLACARKCGFCNKKSKTLGSTALNDKWHCGPGEVGVRPIWSFTTAACGPCLRTQTVKEIDLLLSASLPSALLSALPFIFFTNELHVVASTSLHQGQHPPSNIQITKYYLKANIEDIKKENVRVKGLGNAAAEEWVKGLNDRGKAKRLDIARWERWEASGGLLRIIKDEPDSVAPEAIQRSLPSSLPPRPATFHGYSGFGQPLYAGSAYPPPPGVTTQTGTLGSKFVPGLPQRLESPLLYGAHGPPGTQKASRTKEEAERLKLARRAEIERRCGELHPPISPSVLAHMPSFQASLHIIKPLDDTAWDMLKPRLLAQRADAEQREKERLASTRVFQQHQALRQHLEGHTPRTEESIERGWEETQTIVKNRIATYSDEVIRDGWASGTRVSKELCSRFAAEVLIYVRKRFYAEIAKDDAAARAAGVPPLLDPPNGPFTRKLTLENMRWVYETKIKAHTDQYRKELFLCNACDTLQWFTLEGVCEHYASNHKVSLSSGSTAVNWRAEWPEEPLFNPEPHLARKPKVAASERPTSSGGVAVRASVASYPAPQGLSPLQAVSHVPAAPTYPPPAPQAFQQPTYSEPYNPPLSYMAPGPYQPYPPTTQVQHYAGPTGTAYAPFYQQPPPEVYSIPPILVSQGQVPYHQAYANAAPADAAPVQLHMQHGSMGLPPSGAQSHIPPPVYRTEEYKAQLQDMALTAKALWTETAGVKDMAGSVRVHIILFHLLKRLRERYTEDPPLSMFVDGIQNSKEMRIVRNVNGIACKTCTKENANKPINPYTVSTKTSAPDRRLYSLPQLVNHFQSAHSGASGSAGPDWRTDMMELPDRRKIRSLKESTGMDDHKFRLLIEAFPEAFRPDTPEASNRDLPPSVDKHDSYYQPDRSPTPITQLDEDVRKLFNPEMDNYPRQFIRGRVSRTATGSGSGGSSLKRKATSPLGGRHMPIQPDNVRYFDARLDEREDQPRMQIEMEQYRSADGDWATISRPEYNHHGADLSRLLANAGHAAPPQEHAVRPAKTQQPGEQGMAAVEQFLDSMPPRKSWEALLHSERRPREVDTTGSSQHADLREGRSVTRMNYNDRQDVSREAVSQNKPKRSPPRDHAYQPSPKPADPRYVRERTTFIETRTIPSQAPSREQRYANAEVLRYAGENRGSGSPVYVVEEAPHRRQYRRVSPGGQHYVDDPHPVVRRVGEDPYSQRQDYYEYPEKQFPPRQAEPEPEPEPEVEYIRVRDPAGDYLVARQKTRQQPIYVRYEDDREPVYENSRMRPVYEDEHVPVYVSQASQRPRQVVYADETIPRTARYEDDDAQPIARYEERTRPVVTRIDDDRLPFAQDERPRPRQQVYYEDEVDRRHPVYHLNPSSQTPISRSDPAYYEEYDPRNPAPLPEAPLRLQRPQ